MRESIRNYNKGLNHGYQEVYWGNKLSYRTNYKNGRFIGYSEWSGMAPETNFYII